MNTARLNQGTPLLLNAVSKHYAENIVLNQLDLHIPAGQFVAVVGRSGETIGEICNKYFAAREGVSTEDRQRIMRFLENMCLGAAAVGYRTESMHGAGSPQAQRVMIARQGNIQGKKKLAKNIAGIQE